MDKEKPNIQKEIEDYFVESAGYGRDRVINFMGIVDKALSQKSERIEELEKENEYLCTKCEKLEETLKKVRVTLVQERAANIMNYGKGGVEMFSDIFEMLKEGGK